MKTINRLIAAALVLFTAAACYNKEIESPDDSHNPQTSDFRITASIIQTRVTYSDSDENLNQQWAVDDVLFGYIGGEAKEANRISFTVKSVDPTTHIATLDAGSYKSTLVSSVGKVVDLVYTGQGQSSYEADGSVQVSMSAQSVNGKIPACMHSRATVAEGGLEFTFTNDCAIFEIVELTGINEEKLLASLPLSSIVATNLYQSGEYTLGENGFKFAGVEGSMGEVSLSLGGSWKVNTNGTITDGTTSRALIAVVPIAEADKKDIRFTSQTTSQDFSFDYGAHELLAGVCYVIGSKEVVAKTADGQYFTTVTDAFAHARILDATHETDVENKVTLLKSEIDGLGTPVSSWDDSTVPPSPLTRMESIDFPVTLELNGCKLTLNSDDGYEYFQVEDTSTFTIKDSEEDGEIISSGDYMIRNSGTVNIECGKFTMDGISSMVHNDNDGVLTIKGGTLQSSNCCVVENYGTLNVEGGEISSEGSYPIDNTSDGTANISAGTISCVDFEAVANTGTLTITGGTLTSDSEDNTAAITNLTSGNITIDGDCVITSTAYFAIDVSQATLDMKGGTVSGALGGILLSGASKCTISDGSIESENGYALYVENSQCEVSGGTIKSESTTKPAVYCFTDAAHKDYFSASSPNLLITWPEEGESADVPLIVSSAAASDGKSFGAVSTANPKENENEKTNYAIVEISGGYLYSSDDAFCSIAGESSLLFTGSFYTNMGGGSPGSFKSPYYDFSIGNYVFVPSENVSTITCGEKEFAFMISPEWTYVIDNCSQTKTAIGADEEVTYSFRSYKQKGTEKEPVPWKAQMYVDGNAGYGWNDNHNYGDDGDNWHWTTNRDDKLGNADKGDGSIDTNEEYIIKFMSTKSDTYTVRIIASDAGGSITYTFAPVVQTISSTPSTDPTVTELWSDGPTTSVTISSSNFDNINLEVGDSLWIYYKLKESTTPNNASIRMWVSDWSYQQINFNGTDYKEAEDVVDQYYWYLSIDQELINSLKGGADLGISCDYGANITKVELIQ